MNNEVITSLCKGNLQFMDLSDDQRDDIEIATIALQIEPYNLQIVGQNVLDDIELMRFLMSNVKHLHVLHDIVGMMCEHVFNDATFMLIICRKWNANIRLASTRLKNDSDFMSSIILLTEKNHLFNII